MDLNESFDATSPAAQTPVSMSPRDMEKDDDIDSLESPGSSRTSIEDDEIRGAEEKENQLEPTKSAVSIAETLPLPKEILFVGIVCCAQFTTQCGLGQVLALLHVIGNHYGLKSAGDLSWLIAGYSLTVGTFILISGRLGDLFGWKRLFIIGFSWFSFWSMVAGVAVYSNHVLFVFARVLQGIGPAITLPNGLAILGATYAPGRRKQMAFAAFGAVAPGK